MPKERGKATYLSHRHTVQFPCLQYWTKAVRHLNERNVGLVIKDNKKHFGANNDFNLLSPICNVWGTSIDKVTPFLLNVEFATTTK